MSRISSDYTVLTDHSYSLRIDQEKISLKQQRKKPRRIIRMNNEDFVFTFVNSSFHRQENQSNSINRS